MNIKIVTIEETNNTYEQVLSLIKLAFQERKDAGLNYTCLSLTYDSFIKEAKDSVILVAIDEISCFLCGCILLKILRDKDNICYGKENHTSVHPDYKGQGIGSLLIAALKTKAIELGCEYLSCSTAVDAESAIKVHLKNGYQIIGLKSYKATNYYSYLFRMQLTPSRWCDPAFCRKQYKRSRRRVRVAYKSDGTMTVFGRMLARFGINW